MIELLYLASQIQCGVGGDFLNVQVDVYKGTDLVKTMMVNDRTLVSANSVNELNFRYSAVDNTTNCTDPFSPSELKLDTNSSLPDMDGFAGQSSVQTMLDGLDNYEELLLVELGESDSSSVAFDMQDVIFKIDNDPDLSLLFAD